MIEIKDYISYEIALYFIKNNQVLFSVFITIAIIKLKEISKTNIYFAGIVYFTGTFFHEIAHFIAAFLTTFRFPEKVSLFPKREIIDGKKGIVLGYVQVKQNNINILNAFIIGMAPLSLLYLAYLVSISFFDYYSIWFSVGITAYILKSFLIATLIINSVPSKADFNIAIQKGSLYLYTILILLLIVSFW